MDTQRTESTINLARQVIEFQKATFDNTFDAMAILQDQAERIAASLEPSWGIPGETQKLIDDWVKAFNQSRNEYKKMVHQGFESLEKLLIPAEKEEPAKEPQKKAAQKAAEPAKAAENVSEKVEKQEPAKAEAKPAPKSK